MVILLLEDNKAILDMLKMALLRENHEIIEASNVASAKHAVKHSEPELIIADWMLPDASGLDFVSWLRRQNNLQTLPVLMLTAKSQQSDTIKALDAGVDDYLSKPVAIAELLARIRALGRRPNTFVAQAHLIEYGPIKINTALHQVFVREQEIKIKKTEYKLLGFFIKNPNRVWSRSQLLDRIWGTASHLNERTVDVHILRLRKQLKPYSVQHMISTVHGAGYKLSE